MARRRFFVERIERGHAQIIEKDAHHLTRVLRVEPGQQFEISDNQNVYLAEVEMARKDLVSFLILDEIEAPPPAVHTALFASLIKFERFEWMLEKATELGVSQITPLQTERTERGLERAAAARLSRWKRIAREASEQSRRARLPGIESPVHLAEALGSGQGYRYALEESGAQPILSAFPEVRTHDDRVSLLVGPEGGWTDRERSAIAAAGWTPVWLGATILKAETAAISALAVVNAGWGLGTGG